VSTDTVLEAFTCKCTELERCPMYWPFEEVDALVDFESFLDIDARHEIGAIVHDEVHV
jgi:hypothetical protein